MRPVKIRVEHGGQMVEHEFTHSPIQLGRHPKADLCLPYDFISSWHALIRFSEDHGAYFDLGSTNGTDVQGQRLGPGEAVEFDTGPVRLEIQELTLTVWRGRSEEDSSSVAGEIVPEQHEDMPVPSPQVQAMLDRLRPQFEAFKVSRNRYETVLAREISALPFDIRDAASDWVQATFPASTGSTSADRAAIEQLVAQLVPFSEAPVDAGQARELVERVAEVMKICARGLVEMQAGQETIGREFGVKTIKHSTGLRFALSADEALGYLFTVTSAEDHQLRLNELSAAFNDIMSHQIATLNGVVAGARALLDELEPGAIERGADPGRLTRFRDCWKTFVRRWERLALKDGPLLSVLFGPEFARVYAEIGGTLSEGWKQVIDEKRSDDEGQSDA